MSDLEHLTGSQLASNPRHRENNTTETATVTETNDEQQLSMDQIFHVLSNRRRRQTLTYLTQNGGEATLSDTAEYVTAIENDVSVREINSKQRKRVYVSLYQCHLPKMDDMHIIAFNKDRGTLKLTETAYQLNQYVDESDTTNLSRVYVGLLSLGVVLLATGGLGVAPLSVSNISAFMTLLSGLLISAVIRARSD